MMHGRAGQDITGAQNKAAGILGDAAGFRPEYQPTCVRHPHRTLVKTGIARNAGQTLASKVPHPDVVSVSLDLSRDARAIRRQAHIGVSPGGRIDRLLPPLAVDPNEFRGAALAAMPERYTSVPSSEMANSATSVGSVTTCGTTTRALPSVCECAGSNATAQSAPPAT